MTNASTPEHSRRVFVLGIVVILSAYLATAAAGTSWASASATAVAGQASGPAAADAHAAAATAHPPFWMVLPFVLLLLAIALLPLVPGVCHWWDNNLHRLYVAGGLGALSVLYYLLAYGQPVLGHWPAEYVTAPAASGPDWKLTGTVLSNALLAEYIPFIVLLFSLYTISGGIRIEGDLPAHPGTNTCFLAVGAVLASVIGTTGAAMLLIRPLLETNCQRRHVRHTVIFFIFIVCNCGGLLLPLGDPPLFLGYLFGVPFLWTLHLWPAWLLLNGLLLAIYFLWDRYGCYPREAPADVARDESQIRPLVFRGIWPNALLLVGVILSVALLDPAKPMPGTAWHPWIYLREAVQLGLVAASLLLGQAHVRRANNFTYGAIAEVAALFLGIFLCMQAPLQILHVHGPALGLSTPTHFFWASGGLSAVLDNAPTYAVFFETAQSLGGTSQVAGVQEDLLRAVSLGSVFMGAMTYIGNGPNFMVRSIAEKQGVPMPSFFGYIVYSAAVLLPLFALTTFLFL